MKKLYIYPPQNELNQYIAIQKTAIEKNNVQVTASLKDFFKTQYFLLNWFEKLGNTGREFEFCKKLVKIAFLVVFRKKVFYVLHNKTVHTESTKQRGIGYSLVLQKILLRISARIVILCDETIAVLNTLGKNNARYLKKVYKIPHPNYIGFYAPPRMVRERQKTGTSQTTLRLLFMGRVQRYKNIEILIDCMNGFIDKPVSLTVAGACDDAQYAASLKVASHNPQVHFDFRYVPNDEIATLIVAHDIVVLPYDIASSLNSGNIFLAFSYKRTVISPLIGSLKEYADDSFFYAYSYASADEHKRQLEKAIHRALADWTQNKNSVLEKGEIAYTHVVSENSVEKIASLYAPLLA